MIFIATELYHFRARYFDADLGRFIGRDPLGYVDGMSLYRAYFVPSWMDPYGKDVRNIWQDSAEILSGEREPRSSEEMTAFVSAELTTNFIALAPLPERVGFWNNIWTGIQGMYQALEDVFSDEEDSDFYDSECDVF